MHPLTLKFADRSMEENYIKSSFERERVQGRTAIIVGVIVYLLYGLLDHWLVPQHARETVWTIRLLALTVPLAVFLLSYTYIFEARRHLLLASVGLAAGGGIIAMLTHMPMESASQFYPGMILATFFTYNFIGTRFIYALCIDVLLIIGYNVVFGAFHPYPLHILITHDFFIVSANLIGGTAGYLNERQKRYLFIRECQLDEERDNHLKSSLHDTLTGLPNRELLYDRMRQAWRQAEREGINHCCYFIDLDGFKAVNDRLKHEMGDRVLCEISLRLQNAVRKSDTIARIGGDEFVCLGHGIHSESDAAELAKKLIAAISEPIPGLPADLSVGASIGMCIFPHPEISDISEVLKRADHAMYSAKSGNKGTYVLSTSIA